MNVGREPVANDRITKLLNEIGLILSEDPDHHTGDTLLHAELDNNFVASSVFKERGDHVLYYEPDLDRLGDALLDLWEAEKPENRWAELEYIMRKGKFEVVFTYFDEIDPKEEPLDRRARIVAQYFGDKPIKYPPMTDDFETYKL
jgi:hypothetical protein